MIFSNYFWIYNAIVYKKSSYLEQKVFLPISYGKVQLSVLDSKIVIFVIVPEKHSILIFFLLFVTSHHKLFLFSSSTLTESHKWFKNRGVSITEPCGTPFATQVESWRSQLGGLGSLVGLSATFQSILSIHRLIVNAVSRTPYPSKRNRSRIQQLAFSTAKRAER